MAPSTAAPTAAASVYSSVTTDLHCLSVERDVGEYETMTARMN